MTHLKESNPRDRQEADLLLNVVLAHMAVHNTKEGPARQTTHTRLVKAISILYEFENAQAAEQTADGSLAPAIPREPLG